MLLLFFMEIACFQGLIGATIPENGDTLNYRQVYFRWDPVWQAGRYQLRIWEAESGPIDSPLSPTHHLLHHADMNGLLIREGLAFGKSYAWQVSAFVGDSLLFRSEIRHFYIRTAPRIDPAVYRHRVVKDVLPSEEEFYFFIDKPGVLIDRKGEVVWFLAPDSISRAFNLQLLPNGHIAYFRPPGKGEGNENLILEETSLDGKLIWRAPDDGKVSGHDSEFYHHDFQRLSNGHYMVLGNRFVSRQPAGASGPIMARYGTLIEYNPAGQVVWSWGSEAELEDADVFADGLKDNPTHLNGVFFDESAGFVYLSFRYLDRVIQLEYATRRAANSFGRKMPSGEARSGDGLFFRQHSPKVKGNRLYLYDNRLGNGADSVSSVVVLEIPADTAHAIRLLDRYELNFGSRRTSWSESKGDVDLLPGGRVLACMGSLPRTVVWDEKKGLVWQVEHEHRPDPEIPWQGIEANYRADWTATLHPVQFGVKASGALAQGRARQKAAVIEGFNTGKAGDAYAIEILQDRRTSRLFQKNGPVQPGASWQTRLPLKKSWLQATGGWENRGRSVQNPGLETAFVIPME